MKLVYAGEDTPEVLTKSLFLAGCSSRNQEEVESWRKDAIQILDDIGFEGEVFIPEGRDGKFKLDYTDQVDWEEKHLKIADCILFWIPRDLSPDSKGNPKMAGLTTNVEFGVWADSGKVVMGAPKDADKNTYIKHYCQIYNIPVADSLTETLDNAIEKLGKGAERSGGERYVPLFIWNTSSFQSWYKSQIDSDNKLENAELLYSFRPGFKSFVFLWILRVSIFVASENRSKTNEFVLSRPDISSVLMYKKNKIIEDTEVVIVKEFRSPARTSDSFIRELPGGSSIKPNEDPKDVASEEIHEETGLHLESSRFVIHEARQLAATLSSHKSHLFSVELTDEEMDWLKSQQGIAHGNEADTERTFVEVLTIKYLLDSEDLDWTNIGMIMSVLYKI